MLLEEGVAVLVELVLVAPVLDDAAGVVDGGGVDDAAASVVGAGVVPVSPAACTTLAVCPDACVPLADAADSPAGVGCACGIGEGTVAAGAGIAGAGAETSLTTGADVTALLSALTVPELGDPPAAPAGFGCDTPNELDTTGIRRVVVCWTRTTRRVPGTARRTTRVL